MPDVLTDLQTAIAEEGWALSTKVARATRAVLTTIARYVNEGQIVEALELADCAGDSFGPCLRAVDWSFDDAALSDQSALASEREWED